MGRADDVQAVLTELNDLMGRLRGNVAALNAILETEPEVPDGDHSRT